MIKRAEISVSSPFGERKICVCQGDLMDYPDTIHLLTVSAFERNYVPTLGTLIGALRQSKGISVEKLAENPKVDLREFCDCWISRKMPETAANPNIRRIGCIELSPLRHSMEREAVTQEIILQRIQSYYRILDLLSLGYVNVRRIAMPLLGTGNQKTNPRLMVVPLISETIHYLKRSPATEEIVFMERGQEKADILTSALEQSYAVYKEMQDEQDAAAKRHQSDRVFISYTTQDRHIADLMCRKLEERGIKVWYAPRDILQGSYASAIVDAISKSTHFIPIISQNSMNSEHVLNEVDLAFDQIKRGLVLLPFKTDDQDLRAEFSYYLKRQQWTNAQKPPLEARIEEFVKKVFP